MPKSTSVVSGHNCNCRIDQSDSDAPKEIEGLKNKCVFYNIQVTCRIKVCLFLQKGSHCMKIKPHVIEHMDPILFLFLACIHHKGVTHQVAIAV